MQSALHGWTVAEPAVSTLEVAAQKETDHQQTMNLFSMIRTESALPRPLCEQ